MTVPFAKKLACETVKEHFGDLVEKVCHCLVYKGEQHFGDLLRNTGLSPPQLRNCLLVLVQHNCVQAFRPDSAAGDGPAAVGRVPTFYVANVRAVLHRLRYPKFLAYIRKEHGEEAENVLEGLLEHGRLSLSQICDRTASRLGKSLEEVSHVYRQVLVTLIQEHFVERTPQVEPVLQQFKPTEQTKRNTRGPQRRVMAADGERRVPNVSSERWLLEGAVVPEDRFRVPGALILSDSSRSEVAGAMRATEDALASSRARTSESLLPGVGKRKREEERKSLAVGGAAAGGGGAAAAAAAFPMENAEGILWRANPDEFVRRFRHELCVSKIREKLDDRCGLVLAAMLKATRKSEATINARVSDPLSLETIVRLARESPGGEALTMDCVRASLLQMSADSTRAVTKESISTYVVNMRNVIDEARLREVEGILVQKHGMPGCRIFRLLMLKKRLEQKQIGEMAMIPIKDTRELLYTLFKEEYVQLQEISKTADKAPSRTLYLWYVNLPKVMEKVLNDMCHAASNLRLRLQYELDQEKEVLSLLEQMQQVHAPGSHGSMQPTSLTAGQRQHLERIRRVAAILETSLMRLDDSVMLFNEFS